MDINMCWQYTSKEGASGIVTDMDITTIAPFAALFSSVGAAKRLIIRTDALITIRLNKVTNDVITIAVTDSPFEIDWLGVTKIFITAAASSNLKIIVGR